MHDSVTIRHMIPRDVDAVTSLYRTVFDSPYISFSELGEGKADDPFTPSPRATAIFHDQLAALLAAASDGCFTAVLHGEVIGFALASLHITEAGHKECWLDDLAVHPEWQRGGVAKALVSRVCQWANEGRARYLLLESGIRNSSAHSLFRALGFSPLAIVFVQQMPCATDLHDE
jgi:GNAT superfamily N-acetyltransferase